MQAGAKRGAGASTIRTCGMSMTGRIVIRVSHATFRFLPDSAELWQRQLWLVSCRTLNDIVYWQTLRSELKNLLFLLSVMVEYSGLPARSGPCCGTLSCALPQNQALTVKCIRHGYTRRHPYSGSGRNGY